MGWYLNGCACGERKERLLNYQGDIQKLAEFGFDAAKFDGCGAATNMTYYAALMAATGKTFEVENCHWGHCGEDAWYHNPDGSSCPTHDWVRRWLSIRRPLGCPLTVSSLLAGPLLTRIETRLRSAHSTTSGRAATSTRASPRGSKTCSRHAPSRTPPTRSRCRRVGPTRVSWPSLARACTHPALALTARSHRSLSPLALIARVHARVQI
jgi:hypothetical protein